MLYIDPHDPLKIACLSACSRSFNKAIFSRISASSSMGCRLQGKRNHFVFHGSTPVYNLFILSFYRNLADWPFHGKAFLVASWQRDRMFVVCSNMAMPLCQRESPFPRHFHPIATTSLVAFRPEPGSMNCPEHETSSRKSAPWE